ncbi:helix-turn-helix transcriptional regulator [Pedobacter sp. 22163]|uniref:helix-turn-helix transcriptional regulator n=1 Tax=Pedobacter sp. 22163 TaxID=3453883 RepID=UPI003F87A819
MSNDEILKAKIKSLNLNEDLIAFLEETIINIKETEHKILFLHYAKKLVLQTERPVDQKHYEAFQFEYDQDRRRFNPASWINAELEFLKVLHEFNSSKNQSTSYDKQQNVNAPMPLLRHEDMEKMYRWSRSTLNRRIALGLPYHLDPAGAKFFDVNEVNEWIKENANLMN